MYHNGRRIDILRTYDPRTKLHISLMVLVACLFSWKLTSFLISLIMMATLVVISRTGIRTLLSSCLVLLFVWILLGIIATIVIPAHHIGLFILLKLVFLTISYVAVEKNMKQGEVLDGLAVGFGLRSVTTKYVYSVLDFPSKVMREKRRARKAQIARGVDPGGNIFTRFHKELLLMIPNIASAYIKTIRQNEAMDNRQYISTLRRNCYNPLRLEMTDKVISVIFMLMMLASLLTNILM